MEQTHRIIDDKIEKSIKGRRIGHCAFAVSIFKGAEIASELSTALAHTPTPPIPTPGQAWGTYVVCGLCVNLPSAKTFFNVAVIL